MSKSLLYVRHLLPLITLFFVLLTITATGAVVAGLYMPVMIILMSAAATGGVYYWIGRYITFEASVYDWFLIGFVIIWTACNGFLASEHLFTDRDPATYANTSVMLSRNQTILLSQTHVFDDVAGAGEESAGFTLNNNTGNIDAQGQHALPAVIGVFGSLLGEQLSLRFNAVVGGVALIAVYLAARLYLRPQWALGSVGILGFTLPMMYFSRDMYTEPLAMLIAWTALLFFVTAFKHKTAMGLWSVAGITLGDTGRSRIDAGLFMAGVFAGILFLQLATKQTSEVRRGIVLSVVASLPFVVLAIYDLWRYSHLYLMNHFNEITLQYTAVTVLALSVVVVALIGYRMESAQGIFRSILTTPRLYAIGGIILAACFFGLMLRPYVAPSKTVNQNEYVKQVEAANGITETGVNDYRQYTVDWVGWYIGEAVLILGIIGVIGLVVTRLSRHHTAETLLVATIGASAWYLYSPSITPDQIWASRRFLVVLIPGLIVCAMVVLGFMARKLPPIQYRQAYIVAGFLLVISPILVTAEPLFANQRLSLHSEPIQQFCSSLPDNAAVLWLGLGRLEAVAPTRIMCDVPSAGFSDETKSNKPDNPTRDDLQQYASSLKERGYTPIVAVFEENLYALDDANVAVGNLTKVAERNYAILMPTIFGAPRDIQVIDSAIYVATVSDRGTIIPLEG